MRQYKTMKLFMILPVLIVFCLASGAWCSLPWTTRQGTIANAKSLPDGSSVYLDAEDIVKIKAQQYNPYFLITEPFDSKSKLVVLTPPSSELRLGQIVDIEGEITTLPDGITRAITDVTVWGYTDADGNLLYHGPLIKGLLEPTQWKWMVDLTVRRSTRMFNNSEGTTAEQPNTNLDPGPDFYPEISDILSSSDSSTSSAQTQNIQSRYNGVPDVIGLLDASLVELQCKRITAVGTEMIDGITYNYMDVTEDLPSTDTIRAFYTGNASTTDRINQITGQIRHVGTIPVICVDAGPNYNPQIFEGTCQLAAQGSIAWAKTFADGAQLPAQLTGKIVSGEFYALGYLYIQEPNRASGIRVRPTADYWTQNGDRITIASAQITTENNQRVLSVSPSNIGWLSNGNVNPIGMNNKTVTGGSFNVFTPGATGVFGLNNVGVLVKTWGKVTDVQPSCFFINDGSDTQGVKVDLNIGGNIPHNLQDGDYGAVTGIASLENMNDHNIRVIKPRGYYDIQLIQAVPHFTNIAAHPGTAAAGDVVAITFSVDAALAANPIVTVNGHSAVFGSVNGYDYIYEYTVLDSEQPGWAKVTVSGTGTSGIHGSASNSSVLVIGSIGFDNKGHRSSALDLRGVTRYEHDVLGRLTKVTEPDGKWISYEYDLNNNRTKMTIHLSDNPLVEHVTNYDYNDRNLLWHVTDQLGGVTTYTYKPNCLVDTITYPNGTKAIHAYSNRNRLTQISNQKSDNTIIAQFDYICDTTYWGKNGTVTSVVENILKPDASRINAQVDYEYDSLYRLTREHRVADPNTQNADPGVAYDYYYTYDQAGNRISWQVVNGTTTNYTYDAANKMTAPGVFTYDDAGNTLTHTLGGITTTYTWNDLNQMVKWEKTGNAITNFVYNSDGIRVRKTCSDGTVTNFMLDGKEIVEEITGENAPVSYVGSELISQISSTTYKVYHADGFGNIHAMSDNNSPVRITASTIYDAYGNTQPGFTNTQSFTYAGMYRCYNDSTGLYYLEPWYDPNVGRSVSQGQTGHADGLNLYTYKKDNPVELLDP